jgi:hypothetical protein
VSTPLLIAHVGGCPWRNQGHSDAAKRISDATIMHSIANGWDVNKYWCAFLLEDGKSPDAYTLYDSKRDAVRHQSDEFLCMYVKLRFGGFNVCECEATLKYHRAAYLKGYRLPDPDQRTGGRDLIPRIGSDKMRNQIRALANGGRK